MRYYIYFVNIYRCWHKRNRLYGTFRSRACAVLKEEYERRFPYLIGWQKAENSLADGLTDGQQKSSHLILELKGLRVLERRAQLPPVRARSHGANPNLGISW